jgi:protein-S-isoprenylcysteine O-methyltransferase Ste14
MMFTGIGLALGSWPSLAVLFGITLAVYLYRMPVEERALLTTFGGAYWVYMRTRRTPRIPTARQRVRGMLA